MRSLPLITQAHLALALALLAAGLASEVAGPAPARACSTLADERAFVPPAASVPGNLIRIRVLTDRADLRLALTNIATGEAVAASIRRIGSDRVFSPDAPLAPGLRLRLGASGLAPDDLEHEPLGEHEFVTTEHVETELGLGKLTLVRHTGAEAVYRYDSPDTTGALGELVQIRATVDGQHLATTTRIDPTQRELVVRTTCDGTVEEDSCGGVYSFGEGPHRLEVTAHVFGQEMQPEPVSASVELYCDACSASGSGARDGALLLVPLALWARRRRTTGLRRRRG